jgi:hypothetical protein
MERSSGMRVSWGVFYLFLWSYRSAASVFADRFVSGFTSLGDSGRFQAGGGGSNVGFRKVGEFDLLDWTRFNGTILTDVIGGNLSSAAGGSSLLVNISFQSIAFVGIVVLLRSVQGQMRWFLAGAVMLPSFTIWSSLAGKEALVVFSIGILGAYVINGLKGDWRFGAFELVALALIFLLKNHYMPAIIFLIVGLFVTQRVRQKGFVILLGGIVSLIPLYLFRDAIDSLSFNVIRHFIGYGSSRVAFWENPYDVFVKAPYGMFLAFFGPTLAEANGGLLQMASFLESTLLVAGLALLLIWRLPRLPVFAFIAGVFTLFWILFATYPLGILNAGSAVRYRTGYELLVLVVVIVVMSRDAFVSWPKPAIAPPSTLADRSGE